MREQNFADFLQAYEDIEKTNTSFVVATLVSTKGSAPQNVGARIIIDASKVVWGTVGGGKIEARVIQEAQVILQDITRNHQFSEWNLQTEIGMTCGGLVGIFFEKHDPKLKWKVAVFGAGHVGQALVRHLMTLDVDLTCIDHREEWLNKLPQAPQVKAILTPNPKDLVGSLDLNTFVVIMTMGHATDLPILQEALKLNFPYIGNMGSEQKAKVLKRDLMSLDLTESQVEKLHCPIGEPFGNNSPNEIAISVIAQLLKIRDLKK